jgi:hypothetical protein
MCINAEVSIATFIIASIVNIIIFTSTTNINYLMLSGIYQFIILIQLFEFLAWKDQKCGKINEFATKSIFVATTLQPVVITSIILLLSQVKSLLYRSIVTLSIIIYTGKIFYDLYYGKSKDCSQCDDSKDPITCLKPTKTCKHLQFGWWEKLKLNGLYIFPIFLSILLLVNTFKFAMFHVIYLIITGLLGSVVYSCNGLAGASSWCLLATGGPILNYILMKNNI